MRVWVWLDCESGLIDTFHWKGNSGNVIYDHSNISAKCTSPGEWLAASMWSKNERIDY